MRSAELIPGYISDLYSAFYPMTLASPARCEGENPTTPSPTVGTRRAACRPGHADTWRGVRDRARAQRGGRVVTGLTWVTRHHALAGSAEGIRRVGARVRSWRGVISPDEGCRTSDAECPVPALARVGRDHLSFRGRVKRRRQEALLVGDRLPTTPNCCTQRAIVVSVTAVMGRLPNTGSMSRLR